MINFIKTLFFHYKKKYGYLSQEFNDSQMSSLSQNIPNKQSDEIVPNVSKYEASKYIFPSYEAFEKACYAFIEEEQAKESETGQVSKRPRRSVQSVDKTEVRKERVGKVRNVHSQKTSKGNAKRTLRKPSAQGNKVGRRKLPPSVRGL